MSILEKYLKAVQSCLGLRNDDIFLELSENLREQMKERASELGRPLTEEEQEVILRRHGNPAALAATYRRQQERRGSCREWIGPDLFRFFLQRLLVSMGLTTAIFLVMVGFGFRPTIGQIVFPFLIQVGFMTLMFAAIEAYRQKSWNWWKQADCPKRDTLAGEGRAI